MYAREIIIIILSDKPCRESGGRKNAKLFLGMLSTNAMLNFFLPKSAKQRRHLLLLMYTEQCSKKDFRMKNYLNYKLV